MIKLVPNPTFEYPVKLTVPGQAEPVEISLTFRYMNAADTLKWFQESKEKEIDAAIGELVSGWKGIEDESGKEAAYTPAALRQLLIAYQPSALEIIKAWQIGLTESRVKN